MRLLIAELVVPLIIVAILLTILSKMTERFLTYIDDRFNESESERKRRHREFIDHIE